MTNPAGKKGSSLTKGGKKREIDFNLDEPDGKVAKQCRQAFRLSYLSFKVKIFDFAVKTWWPDWEEYQVDAI